VSWLCTSSPFGIDAAADRGSSWPDAVCGSDTVVERREESWEVIRHAKDPPTKMHRIPTGGAIGPLRISGLTPRIARTGAGGGRSVERIGCGQGERRDDGVELFAGGRDHPVAPVHGPDRCLQRAEARVLECVARR
jgi:hypothetical protein